MGNKLWLISQDENDGYDTYSKAVVAAPDEATARRIHPAEEHGFDTRERLWTRTPDCWASKPENVNVQYLGVTDRLIETGVVLASFHAG